MKLKILFSLLGLLVLTSCSQKDTLFDDSRQCRLITEDETDAFGTVIRKAGDVVDCPYLDLDPCLPQLKNRALLGEMTDDTENSLIVCPEVMESPVLPSDYTEENNGSIDIYEDYPNKYPNPRENMDKKKTQTEPENMFVHKGSNIKLDADTIIEEGSISPFSPKPEKPKTVKKAQVKSKKDEKKSTIVKKPQAKKKVKEKTPSVAKKTTPVASKKKSSKIAKKTIKIGNTQGEILYKMTLGPFFVGKNYVPYRVKVDLEKHIAKVKVKFPNRKWKFRFTAYYFSGSSKAKNKNIATQRVNQLIEYTMWKENISKSSFDIVLKPTTGKSQAQRVEILLVAY